MQCIQICAFDYSDCLFYLDATFSLYRGTNNVCGFVSALTDAITHVRSKTEAQYSAELALFQEGWEAAIIKIIVRRIKAPSPQVHDY